MLFVAALGWKGNGFDQYRQGQNKHLWVCLIGKENCGDNRVTPKLKKICIAERKTKHGKFVRKLKYFTETKFFGGCGGGREGINKMLNHRKDLNKQFPK